MSRLSVFTPMLRLYKDKSILHLQNMYTLFWTITNKKHKNITLYFEITFLFIAVHIKQIITNVSKHDTENKFKYISPIK